MMMARLQRRIVAFVEHDAQSVFGVGVTALGDALFGELATRVAEILERVAVERRGSLGRWG